ncbi:MAG: hypothetical protein R3F43_27965 [bacterium]
MKTLLLSTLTAALALFGCDDGGGADPGPDASGVGGAGGAGGGAGGMGGTPGGSVLSGRIDSDAGNQATRAGASKQTLGVSADLVVLIAADGTEVATAVVGGDGRFRFEGVPDMAAPYLVEARAAGAMTGQVLGLLDVSGGGETPIMPISPETTAEVAAYLALTAGDQAVDAVGLISRVSQELAAQAGAGLDGSVADADAAYRAALSAGAGLTVTAEALQASRIDAFARLVAALDAAADAEAEADAWGAWGVEDAAAIEAAFGADARARADAASAAGFALVAGLQGDAGFDAAAVLATRQAGEAEEQAVDAAVAGNAQAEGRVEAAFDAFQAALTTAADAEAVAEAHATLRAALIADADSVLAAVLAAEGESTDAVAIQALLGAQAGLGDRLQANLAAAGQAEGMGEAVGAAVAEGQAHLGAIIQGQLGADRAALVAPLAALLAGFACPCEAPEEGDGAPPALEGDGGGDFDDAGLQAGADDAVADAPPPAEAEGSRLVILDTAGAVAAAVAGTADAEGYAIDLPRVLAEGSAVIEVLAEGRVIGARRLEGDADDGGQVPGVTAQSTVEALIAARLAREGEDVEPGLLVRLVDGAVADAALSGGDAALDALAEAVLAAQLAFTEHLEADAAALAAATAEARADFEAAEVGQGEAAADATAAFYADVTAQIASATGASAEAQADAMVRATAAFEAVIDALAGPAPTWRWPPTRAARSRTR